MKLSIRHTFPCSPKRFWEMVWDEDFNARLDKHATVKRELLREWKEGDVECWRARFTPDRELPAPIAAVLGAAKLVYEQDNKLDKKSGTLRWQVFPVVMGDKITATGTMHVREVPGGCERAVDGDVTVKMMLVGGKIEQAIVRNVEESYEKAAAASRDWLSVHGTAVSGRGPV